MGMQDAIQIQLIDFMGSDLMVVNTARVSFHKESEWVRDIDEDGCTTLLRLNDRDEKLIRFLAREKHTTPFRHPQLHLRCKGPIFLARQLGKHQIGMSWNEVSRRYVDEPPEFYVPDCWRKRPEDGIKQGSSGECVEYFDTEFFKNVFVSGEYESLVEHSLKLYNHMLEAGVAPEMARMVLPQSMLTEWIWTGSLYAFFNVWKQRADGHAQREAQYFAELLDEVIPDELRFSWETLKEYRP